jgi:anoctamin-8
MEGIIDIGYITLFAAAFPMGPFLSLLVNTMEIKMKLYSFLYVYKRPPTQRCSGIGDWLDILEIMSLVSVVTIY